MIWPLRVRPILAARAPFPARRVPLARYGGRAGAGALAHAACITSEGVEHEAAAVEENRAEAGALHLDRRGARLRSGRDRISREGEEREDDSEQLHRSLPGIITQD